MGWCADDDLGTGSDLVWVIRLGSRYGKCRCGPEHDSGYTNKSGTINDYRSAAGYTGPLVGEMPVTVGVPTYVNLSAGEVVLVPVGVVTVTSTVPAALAGLDTTISEPVFTMIVPAAEPNFTEVAPVNVVPVTITSVPPAVVPYVGEIPVTVGVTGESVKV